ncbi:MAG: Fic family protein [Chitinophagaceae bacterium]|nr:Fic family protein [Chitinophagaceae bacterium]
MRKIPPPRLEEVLFGSADKAASARISDLEKKGIVRKIAPRLYTSNLQEDPAVIIRRNWYKILATQYPDALLSHRSALDFRPTPQGHIFLTYTYTQNIALPGLTIHFLEGPSRVEGDQPFFDALHVSGQARAFLENCQPSRLQGEASKVLPQAALEERLEKIIQVKGEKALNNLRDEARKIAGPLRMEKEFTRLNQLISALLSTGESKRLTSPSAIARVLGEPFDAGRIDLFENLYQALASATFPDLRERNDTILAYRNFAFFESYFSNYIEGTEFLIEEAKAIIASETPLPTREDDSHDVLGTYQIVSSRQEMSIVPADAAMLLSLLRERHAILLRARISKKPGEFKDKNNRAGNTEFVDKDLVAGTLKKGFEWYSLLKHPFAKAAYIMFLVSEVHPFLDGNGRIARVMMNAELTAAGFSKIIIPTVYREDYTGALKQFSNQRTPDAYVSMLLRAWQFSANIYGEDREAMEDLLNRSDAFKEPKHGRLKIIHRLTVGNNETDPFPVPYGKSIAVRSSKPGVEAFVFNATGNKLGKTINDPKITEIFPAEEIASIHPQMIKFKAAEKDTAIEFEYF